MHPELHGSLDAPESSHSAPTLAVSGWVFSSRSPIRTLELVLEGQPPVAMMIGLPRPDVAKRHDSPYAAQSGFHFQLPVDDRWQGRTLRFTVVATLEDARKITCFARTVLISSGTQPVSSRIILQRAAAKAWRAARERRLPWSPVWWVKALGLHWREHTVATRSKERPHQFDQARLDESYRSWLAKRGRAAEDQRAGLEDRALLSVVALVDDPAMLRSVVRSVTSQTSDNWALTLACLTREVVDAAATLFTAETGVPARNISVLAIGEHGPWMPPGRSTHVVLLDTRTVLAPDGLCRIEEFISDSDAVWIYTDDDRIDRANVRCDPYLKGAFNRELCLFDDFAARVAIVRRHALEDAGGLQGEYGDAQIYELLLRVAGAGGAIAHLADVCGHRSTGIPAALGEAHERAAARALLRDNSRLTHDTVAGTAWLLPRIAWSAASLQATRVTIVIPTRDRVDLLRRCVESLRRTTNPSAASLLIVDDHSEQSETIDYLRHLEHDVPHCRVVRPPMRADGFNYSRLMNFAMGHVESSLVLHLNNDVEALASGWLDQMAGWLTDSSVGVVGAKLVYEDGSIQHAGVHVPSSPAIPEHSFHRLAKGDPGYQWLPHRTRSVTAVTGACLLTRTEMFAALGGFDEAHLAVQFNDIDYCLRVWASGKRVIYEAAAVLLHRAGASRGRAYDYRENTFFMTKYRDFHDRTFSPHWEPASLSTATPVLPFSRRDL